MKTIISKLSQIQSELNCPKNQKNTFGKYAYRSCEDILSAVKNHLASAGVAITLSDDIVERANRVYVQATASILCLDTGESHSVTAYAREADSKKGMDDSQLTGATSSYARKYALCGLLAIDDTKDADTDAYTEHTQRAQVQNSKPMRSKTDAVKNAVSGYYSAAITDAQTTFVFKYKRRLEDAWTGVCTGNHAKEELQRNNRINRLVEDLRIVFSNVNTARSVSDLNKIYNDKIKESGEFTDAERTEITAFFTEKKEALK